MATALAAVSATPKGALPDYGLAPPIHAGGDWINSKPLTLAELRGKVVLIDFWTYSCINCLRTLPHVKAWYATYRKDGLVVIGVHTPEFAFEHVASNVKAAVKRLGITYPVVQDNDYKTWDNYANEYWPAEYLIDKSGHIRHTHFGEGEYPQTEQIIRRLLDAKGPMATSIADMTPTGLMTPETYLGYARLADYGGTTVKPDKVATYVLPRTLAQNEVSYGGQWTIGAQQVVAGKDATIGLHFHAEDVYVVLGGRGTVTGHDRRQARRDDQRRRAAALHGLRITRDARRDARPPRPARRAGLLLHVRLARYCSRATSGSPSSPSSRSRR